MLVCMFDMILFPILWSLLQTMTHSPITQWNPLTLQGAGLFHIAMGAVLGIAAFGRTQEKLNGANNGGMQPVAQSVTTTYGAPSTGFGAAPGGFGSPTPTPSSFSSNTGFGATTAPATAAFAPKPVSAPAFGAPTFTSSSGKTMPAPAPEPEL